MLYHARNVEFLQQEPTVLKQLQRLLDETAASLKTTEWNIHRLETAFVSYAIDWGLVDYVKHRLLAQPSLATQARERPVLDRALQLTATKANPNVRYGDLLIWARYLRLAYVKT
ncbi:hypothetical protein AB5N19_07826 [Seiridium cardinale]